MIEKYDYFVHDFKEKSSKELRILSIISQSFFQPFSLNDNLLVILTALTSGSGIGFNRAMLFLKEENKLKGEMWLGPRSEEEAHSIWKMLSTPGIGYLEIVEYNRSLLSRNANALSNRIKNLTYSLNSENSYIPARAVYDKKIIVVKDAWNELLVDTVFQDVINVNSFVCIPLLARDEVLGEIILDNAITHAPIEEKNIELASICALIASNYIYKVRLHRKIVEMRKFAAMGEMAMFIAHQLRNPLVTIGGFTDQLLDPDIDDERKKRNLYIIRKEIRRLEKILFQISKYFKLGKGELVSTEIESIIDSVLKSTEVLRSSQEVISKLEIEEGLPRIICDPIYVEEALRNLLNNALDATSQGGSISIKVYRESQDWVVIIIKDTGVGIPEHIKGKIYDLSFSTKSSSMGLGLSYVQRVIDVCKGKMKFESEEGKGTIFKLYFKTE